jgi:hypothetical protein
MLLLLKQQRVSNASSSSRRNVSVIATLSRSASMRSTGFVSKTISRYEHYSRFLFLTLLLLLLLLLLPCRSMLPSSNSSFPWTMSNCFERTAIPLIAPWFPQRIKPHHQPGFFPGFEPSLVNPRPRWTSTRIFSTTSAMLPSLPFGLPVLPRRIPHVSALWSLSCGTKWAMLGKLLHDGFVCNTIFKMPYDLL